tara:strand:- start:590 stop:829 length:240 start_codon:yes stop_codon:yes gene_type:complete
MPDFEALIRQQQIKQPKENQRLKIVSNSNNQSKGVDNKKFDWTLLTYFAVGLIGALIGSISILFLEINKFIPFELLKIN